ncbi:hypothetical protein F4779DRAFT_620895 [Xylariaceae sp. FL0662B]|nr:hypothetical protein F4779DRAFT_620895 [Xylariaceae sp. FL0662B]
MNKRADIAKARDVARNTDNPHGAGAIKINVTYYLIGEDKTGGSAFQRINCYSSADLVLWSEGTRKYKPALDARRCRLDVPLGRHLRAPELLRLNGRSWAHWLPQPQPQPQVPPTPSHRHNIPSTPAETTSSTKANPRPTAEARPASSAAGDANAVVIEGVDGCWAPDTDQLVVPVR